jgi:TolB-like protein/DNA-binding SARP family transcriptional activator
MDRPLDNGAEGRVRWSLRLFGGFELSRLPGGERLTSLGKRERVLLAYLALSPKSSEQRRKVTTLLWGDAADETTLENLRNCLWSLRKALGDAEHRTIASDGEDIVLDTAAFDVDALTFRWLAAQSGRAELEEAAKLYSGGLLDGLDIESEAFESWRREDATRFKDQAIDVLARLMAQRAESGEIEQAVDAGRRILRLEPLHESALRRLMRLYADSERRPTAIQLYRTLSDALKADLGAQPEAETRAVFAEISRGGEEQTQVVPAAGAPSVRSSTDTSRPSYAPEESLRRQAGHSAGAGAAARRVAPLKLSNRTLGWIAAGGTAAAAVAILLFMPFVSSTAPSGIEPAKTSASDTASVISLAVLPFTNLSGDSGQEFFSDGITEEITTALAKVPGLRVVGRTSAYQFKDEKRDLRAIGQALAATRLIEGSVRKTGDRLRISVQLIDANDGTQLWSETYDRLLTDIFVVQEDIARSIATSLRVPLGLAPGGSLISNRAIDPDSYQQYLHAKALLNVQGSGANREARPILEQLLVRNPDYAPAWALLSAAYGADSNRIARSRPADEALRVRKELDPKREAAARRAIELDPNLADGYRALGATELSRQKLLLSEDLMSEALALDPNNQDTLFSYGNLLVGVGRLKEALAVRRQLRAIEPYVPLYNSNLADSLWLDGQNDAALAILKEVPGRNGLFESAGVYASMGRYGEAADAMLEISSMKGPPAVATMAKEAARLLRTAPAASPQELPWFVYLYIGVPSRVLEQYEREGEAGFFSLASIAVLWHPSLAPVRKTERFKAYVRKAGLVEYWRARGWPEFCRPMGADDFVCD